MRRSRALPRPRRPRCLTGARRFSAIVVLFLVLPVHAAAQASGGYRVGPEDLLSIAVWGQPDLTGRYSVEADGTLAFPLTGPLQVSGRTLLEIQEELRRRLSDRYVKNPQVTVAVEQYRSQQIFIVGEVQKAGSYPLTGAMTLLEALALAGSTTQHAGPDALIVRHELDAPRAGGSGPATPEAAAIRVPLDQLQRGDLSHNMSLRAGDTVFIPRADTAFVFGHVNRPGEYALRNGDTTVLQVLSLAGGMTDRGSSRRIRIIRQAEGTTQEIKAGLNDTVRPGDTVMVGERMF